jgi:hypothetical protein
MTLAANPPIPWTPSKAARAVAKRALERRAKLAKSRRGGLSAAEAARQGITSGVEQAERIAAGRVVDAMQLHRFFSRFAGMYTDAVLQGKSWERSKVLQAWDLWGGDPAREAVAKLVAKQRSEKRTKSRRRNPNDDLRRLMRSV